MEAIFIQIRLNIGTESPSCDEWSNHLSEHITKLVRHILGVQTHGLKKSYPMYRHVELLRDLWYTYAIICFI